MGTRVSLISDLSGNPGDETFEQKMRRLHHLVRRWFLQWEGTFSRFFPESDLSRLNRQQEAWVVLSPPFWGLLQAALEGAASTGGLVNPAVLPGLETAGYVQSFERMCNQSTGQVDPASTFPTQGTALDDWRRIRMDPDTKSVYLPAGVRLDLGGFAKGWAADTAARLLGEYCPCLVDAGGDIAISAPRRDGTPWRIGIAQPSQPHKNLWMLPVEGRDFPSAVGVATSSPCVRRWKRSATIMHHLIDPRTGNPAGSDLVQVTVLAPSSLQAEIAAKAVFIQGGEAGLRWLDSQAGLAGFLVYDTGEYSGTDDR